MRPTDAPVRAAARALAAVAAVLVLVGCQTGAPADEPTDQPTETVTSPAPTETPEPAEDPTETAGGAAVNGPNSILVPQDGAVVTGPDVTVSGEGTAFEATLLYQVTRAGTEDVVAEGYTMGGANGEVGPWEIELTLDPGEYDVSVWEPGMGEGDQPDEPVNLVRVTFTVE